MRCPPSRSRADLRTPAAGGAAGRRLACLRLRGPARAARALPSRVALGAAGLRGDGGHCSRPRRPLAQVHSGGWLQATPHAVRGCAVPHVSRATFAVFMEPEWDYPMTAPEGVDPEHTQSSGAAAFLPKGVPPLRTRWGTRDCPFTTCNFGEFTESTFKAYH